mgnify:CR=1 FL=1
MSKDIKNPFADIRQPEPTQSNGPADLPHSTNRSFMDKLKTGAGDWKKNADFRMKICNTCPNYAAPRCKLCGCFMIAKTKIPQAKCPAGKW